MGIYVGILNAEFPNNEHGLNAKIPNWTEGGTGLNGDFLKTELD
jgi:hypothetical protein